MNTSYMDRDYLDFYTKILEDIPSKCPEWTDNSDSDFGIVLVQYFCGIGDKLSYLIDRAVNESFLSTAEERSSVIKLCKMLNYTLHQRYASTGRIMMAMNLLSGDSSIPAYSQFSTVRDVDGKIYYFENTEEFLVYESVFDVIKSFTYIGSVYGTNYALEGNTEQDFTPQTYFNTDDCLYFGYKHMFNNVSIRVTTPTVGLTGIWEYYMDSEWIGISNIIDGTNAFFVSGDVSFILPALWNKTTLDGVEAYYIRFRVTSVTQVTMGVLNYCKINDLVYDWLTVKEGTLIPDEILGSSTGKSGQYFTLSNTGYEEGSLVIEINEGSGYKVWTPTLEILNEDSGSSKYWIENNASDNITVYFGDDVHGRIPVINSPIKATYRICSGKLGNVGYNTITRTVSSISFINAVNNVEIFTGGDDRESIEEARVNASSGLITNQRAVNEEDYALKVKEVSGVKDAKAYLNPDAWKEMWVYVLPEGGGSMSADLEETIQTYIDSVKTAGTEVILKDVQTISINADIFVKIMDNYTATDIQEIVEETYSSLMSMDNRSLAQPVLVSKIYEALEAIDGVDYVSITSLYKEGDSAILNNIIEMAELEIANELNTAFTYSGGSI